MIHQRLAPAAAMLFLAAASSCFIRTASAAPPHSPLPPAFLTVAYESTDISHIACLLEYPDEQPRWVGFGPKLKYKVLAGGAIDGYSLERDIERYVRFRVDPRRLARAEKYTRSAYRNRMYVLGVNDCVTFAIDLAHAAGLEAPSKVHVQVENLIDKLAERNAKRVVHRDELPYPWKRCPILARQLRDHEKLEDFVTVRLDYVRCRETESVGIRDHVVFVAVTEFGESRRIRVGRLADDESWTKGALLFRVPRGTAIGFQVWDADTINSDDLVFQSSFCACRDGHSHQQQERGRAFRASRSRYEVGYSISKAK